MRRGRQLGARRSRLCGTDVPPRSRPGGALSARQGERHEDSGSTAAAPSPPGRWRVALRAPGPLGTFTGLP